MKQSDLSFSYLFTVHTDFSYFYMTFPNGLKGPFKNVFGWLSFITLPLLGRVKGSFKLRNQLSHKQTKCLNIDQGWG